MREILFRGKRDDEKWVTGWFCGADCPNPFLPEIVEKAQIIDSDFLYWHEVDPETVGQFTGLCDKRGAKIFEGDLFKFDDEAWESCETSCGTEYNSWPVENCAAVGFHEDTGSPDFVMYKYSNSSVEADLHENHDVDFYEFVSGLEIIGNIHDNPELLEASHE